MVMSEVYEEKDEITEGISTIFKMVIIIIMIVILISLFMSFMPIVSAAPQVPTEKQITLEATLTGSILPNKPIKFYYKKSDEETWHFIDTKYTNSEGKASVSLTLQSGSYDFRAVFEGDEDYLNSEDTKVNISL